MAESTGSVRIARALYDYCYEDDHNGMVSMRQGELYHLLNSEREDWWNVKRPNTLASFYVPRTYIEILGDNEIRYDSQEEINDNGFSGSKGSIDQEDSQQTMQVKSESNDTNLHNNGLKSFEQIMAEDNDESLYINYNGGAKNVTSIQVQYLGNAQRPSDLGFGDGGDYANLDDLRAAAGLPSLAGDNTDQSPESDYANLQQLNIEPPWSPPLPEQSKYQKTIMSKWDMYLDPETNRVFYVHKDTKERSWKPPRDKNMPGTFHNEMYKQRTTAENSPTSPTTEDILNLLPKSSSSGTLVDHRSLERSKEPIEGIIKKAKIKKGGRMGRKVASYVKLEGTNLVFHQIHKKNKPGLIEYMVPLQTCTVEKNPKEITSKKNTILVSSEDPALQTILMYEDEGKMQDWFLRLQMKFKEMGGPAEAPPTQLIPQTENVSRIPSIESTETQTQLPSSKARPPPVAKKPNPSVGKKPALSQKPSTLPQKPSLNASSLPREILRMDTNSIELYKKALEDGTEKDFDIRIMIVGQVGVGKTSLTKRLLKQGVNLDERESTDGIDVHVRRCKVSLKTQTWIESTDTDTLSRIASVIVSNKKQVIREQTAKGGISCIYPRTDGTSVSADTENFAIDDTAEVGHDKTTSVDTKNEQSEASYPKLQQDYRRTKPPLPPRARVTQLSTTSIGPPLPPRARVTQLSTTSIGKTEKLKTLEKELKEIVDAEKIDKDDYAYVSLWDFGGQPVFYSTHQMFLTDRGIYLLITNLSQHMDDIVIVDGLPYIDYSGKNSLKVEDFIDSWLHSIHGCSKTDQPGVPPVILVGTHTDKLDPEHREKIKDDIFNAIRLRYAEQKDEAGSHILNKDFGLSNTFSDPQFEELRSAILDVAKNQSSWGELKPAKWIRLEKLLEDKRNEGVEVISLDEVKKLNSALTVPIKGDEELDLFLRFQHSCGYIMYYSVPQLTDMIVLRPQFLVDALKSLITAEIFRKETPEVLMNWKEFSQTGILRPSLIDAIWTRKENHCFQDNRHHILALMEHLRIISKPMYSDGSAMK